nr:ACT domain-containing protein [uncultured Holophaga sp.]
MSSPSFAVVTAIGPNRVGIVEWLTGLVSSCNGNISESRMAILGGEFAVIMLLEAEPDQLVRLKEVLALGAPAKGIQATLKPTRHPGELPQGRPYVLETVSLDTPGTVHAATAVLAGHGVDIEALETSTRPAPWSGAPMFHMRATVLVGPEVSLGALKADLAQLEAQRDLDVQFRPLLEA